jgi:hypothetical protein
VELIDRSKKFQTIGARRIGLVRMKRRYELARECGFGQRGKPGNLANAASHSAARETTLEIPQVASFPSWRRAVV